MIRLLVAMFLSIPIASAWQIGAAHADDAALAKEQSKLKGIWVVTSMEFQGKDVENPPNRTMEHHFDGTRVKIVVDHRPMPSETLFYRIDPTTTPKMIDIGESLDGIKNRKGTREGIYEIKGDRLLWAFHIKDGVDGFRERPTEFKTDAESNIIIFKLKRVSD